VRRRPSTLVPDLHLPRVVISVASSACSTLSVSTLLGVSAQQYRSLATINELIYRKLHAEFALRFMRRSRPKVPCRLIEEAQYERYFESR